VVKSKNKSKNAGALDGGGQFLLVDEAVACDAPGQNLSAFGLETLDELDILEVDVINLVFAKTASLLADDFAAMMFHLCVFHCIFLMMCGPPKQP
jgi:hypothetical protein